MTVAKTIFVQVEEWALVNIEKPNFLQNQLAQTFTVFKQVAQVEQINKLPRLTFNLTLTLHPVPVFPSKNGLSCNERKCPLFRGSRTIND